MVRRCRIEKVKWDELGLLWRDVVGNLLPLLTASTAVLLDTISSLFHDAYQL